MSAHLNTDYRLPMPIVENDLRFHVTQIEEAIAELNKHAAWWLYTRSFVEVEVEYTDLTVYIAFKSTVEEDMFTGHIRLSDTPDDIPEDAMSVPFIGTWKLRTVETMIKDENWRKTFAVAAQQHFEEFVSAHAA